MDKQIKVNGQVIVPEAIQYELERLMRFHAQHGMAEDQLRVQMPQMMDQAIQQAIGHKLLMDEATKLNIPVTAAEVDKAVANIEEQVGGAEKLDQALTQQQTTMEDFRRQLEVGVRMDKLVAQITTGAPEPTERDIEEHFATHKEEYAKGEQVLAQHILITPDGDSETAKKEARGKIDAIRERIVNGSDFAAEAATHSACPSGQEGGSLGWFGRGMMVPEFDQAVFAMEVGGVSEVVETQFGYHLIFKTDSEAAGEVELSEISDKIRDLLRHANRGRMISAHVEALKSKADIEIK